MNILIVDDEYYIVKGIDSLINRELLGIDTVFTAYSKNQAQKVFEKEKIDILITDIEMPQGDGLSLIEWVQERQYPVVCLILTGHQRFDYARRAITLHCFGYILKPVDKLTLERELRKAINSISENTVSAQPLPESTHDQNDDFTKKIREHIQENLHSQDLTRNSIARYMHMNPDYLSSVFHAKFHQTLSSYITDIRIDRAKELLMHTSLSLGEISEQVGFSSSSYFHKQFKKATGKTPQQFRK